MDKTSIHARIGEIERELSDLKHAAGLVPPRGPLRSLRRLARLVLSHWVLLSFVATLLVAAYVKVKFDIDYFESYRQQATQRKVGEIHRKLGDRLLAYTEWEAAETSYRRALEVDANNEAATRGLLRSQVFEPDDGKRDASDDVVNARLRYLREEFGDDYMTSFLEAIRSYDRGRLDEMELHSARSVELNPDFPGAYLQLGYMLLGSHDTERKAVRIDLPRAVENFQKASERDPENGLAQNNLGYCRLLQRQFAAAIDHFERAEVLSPSLVAQLNLGDAYRCVGRFADARRCHRFAYETACAPEVEGERYLGGTFKFNSLPLNEGDSARAQYWVVVQDVESKRALAQFHLSFDEALMGEPERAERHFAEALNRGSRASLDELLVNRIEVIEPLLDPDSDARTWFAAKKALFAN